MKLESVTTPAVSLTRSNQTTQAAEPQTTVAATSTGFSQSSRFDTGNAGIWAGPDGGGCVRPPPFPRLPPEKFPPFPFPFPKPIPGPIPLPFPGKVTLSQADRKVARGWADSLSGKGRLLDSPKAPNAQLTRGPDGIMRGPEGEPLVQVKLRDGNTAYVDPNTNRYYLQGQRQGCFGSYSVTKGPFTLPKGAQVSNSHFSDADVRALQREANPPRIEWPRLPPMPPVVLY